jgi:hypothetical protein
MDFKKQDKVYVALLDILGFKELALNNNHEDLSEIYQIFCRAVKNGLQYIKVLEKEKNQQRAIINSITISDSIVLWTDSTEITDFYDLLILVRDLLFHGFFCGLPLRGTMTIGPLSSYYEKIDSKSQNYYATVFGSSIVEAYNLTDKQKWAGAIITDTAIKEYESKINRKVKPLSDPFSRYNNPRLYKLLTIDALIKRKFIRKWQVPLKEKPLQSYYTIDWVSTKKSKFTADYLKASFAKHNKLMEKSAGVIEKINNTINYCISL